MANVKNAEFVEYFIPDRKNKAIFPMSISPISASALYQEQIDYFLNATGVSNLLAKFGVKSTGDTQKDLAKLREIQTKTAINGLQSLSEDDETSETQAASVSHAWYSIMYQLGLSPTGNPQDDFVEIMENLVEKVEKAGSESEYAKYMGLIDLVEDLFIASGVQISDSGADSVSVYSSMQLLASYNKASVERS